ncbi:hypothetical protein G6F35_013658 [Rhizopus arrhizus]|nr:hypothetical protein G6F35_013658 [Rhizopus arrhizus]
MRPAGQVEIAAAGPDAAQPAAELQADQVYAAPGRARPGPAGRRHRRWQRIPHPPLTCRIDGRQRSARGRCASEPGRPRAVGRHGAGGTGQQGTDRARHAGSAGRQLAGHLWRGAHRPGRGRRQHPVPGDGHAALDGKPWRGKRAPGAADPGAGVVAASIGAQRLPPGSPR